jgi:hypothetical protein
MWRRTYLLLLIVRVYFALSPSYLHPDENFQGPEVIAGETNCYPNISALSKNSAQAVYSHILATKRGSGHAPTQSEACSLFGLFMACR